MDFVLAALPFPFELWLLGVVVLCVGSGAVLAWRLTASVTDPYEKNFRTRMILVPFGLASLLAVPGYKWAGKLWDRHTSPCVEVLTREEVEQLTGQPVVEVEASQYHRDCSATYLGKGRYRRLALVNIRGPEEYRSESPLEAALKQAREYGEELASPGQERHLFRNRQGHLRLLVPLREGAVLFVQLEDGEIPVEKVTAWLPALAPRLPEVQAYALAPR